MLEIGRLEKVDVRSVWQTEPEFTRWLEQNHELLADTLGIPIETLTRERSAGDFFVDLVGEYASGSNLIVENQFGRSDHDHLGKVLTYVAAFEATSAVWIVEKPRAEHIKAFAWLNDSTSISFFLVQMQAVRIGDSPVAPQLTLIVGPSEDRGKISEVKKEIAEGDQLRHQFWKEFIEKLKAKRVTLHSNLSPAAGSWISTGAGVSGLFYRYFLGDFFARAELYIDRYNTEAENKVVFEEFLKNKERIEVAFCGPLDWQVLEGRRAKRIAWTTKTGGLRNQESWPALQDELIDAMVRLSSALSPYIPSIR